MVFGRCSLCIYLSVFVLFLGAVSIFIIFFFKQKTAYEMRISDWSSDVCSSDLNRLEQVLASRELRDGVDELLMCDHDGHLVGGLRSNLFWVHDGRLLTPILDRCGVLGTMRERVRRLAVALGIECSEVRARPDVLAACDEGFVTNAVLGIWPLRQIEGRRLSPPGPVTRRLLHELCHPSAV